MENAPSSSRPLMPATWGLCTPASLTWKSNYHFKRCITSFSSSSFEILKIIPCGKGQMNAAHILQNCPTFFAERQGYWPKTTMVQENNPFVVTVFWLDSERSPNHKQSSLKSNICAEHVKIRFCSLTFCLRLNQRGMFCVDKMSVKVQSLLQR